MKVHEYFIIGGLLIYRRKTSRMEHNKVRIIDSFNEKDDKISTVKATQDGKINENIINKTFPMKEFKEIHDFEIIINKYEVGEKVLTNYGYGVITEIDFRKKDNKWYTITCEDITKFCTHDSFYKDTPRNLEKCITMNTFVSRFDEEKEKRKYDVAIVGAGMAGLSCCHDLLKRDPKMRILILESKNKTGGRLKSYKIFPKKCQKGKKGKRGKCLKYFCIHLQKQILMIILKKKR